MLPLPRVRTRGEPRDEPVQYLPCISLISPLYLRHIYLICIGEPRDEPVQLLHQRQGLGGLPQLLRAGARVAPPRARGRHRPTLGALRAQPWRRARAVPQSRHASGGVPTPAGQARRRQARRPGRRAPHGAGAPESRPAHLKVSASRQVYEKTTNHYSRSVPESLWHTESARPLSPPCGLPCAAARPGRPRAGGGAAARAPQRGAGAGARACIVVRACRRERQAPRPHAGASGDWPLPTLPSLLFWHK